MDAVCIMQFIYLTMSSRTYIKGLWTVLFCYKIANIKLKKFLAFRLCIVIYVFGVFV